MPNFICTTCGTQHAESERPPSECAICQDDRQYVKVTGQQWTTLERLRLTHRNSIKFKEPGLIGVPRNHACQVPVGHHHRLPFIGHLHRRLRKYRGQITSEITST